MTARWPRWCLAALLVCTAAMYLVNLTASGYGNAFYAAAAQAGAQSWSAWFFGALDAQDFITVTGLSTRMFGIGGLSVLVPQALMGVGEVAVLVAAVIRGKNHSASRNREIADWVTDHYRGVTVGSSLVYRLTALTRLIDDTIGPASGSSSGTDRPTRAR